MINSDLFCVNLCFIYTKKPILSCFNKYLFVTCDTE